MGMNMIEWLMVIFLSAIIVPFDIARKLIFKEADTEIKSA
jgi:disulfide bond formation protein DsbB